MRLMSTMVLGAAALYGGYWFVGSTGVESSAKAAIEEIRREGWQIDYSSLGTSGFPSRFDTTVEGLTVKSADGLTGWTAPFFQILALSYQPNKVIAIWPNSQTVTLGGEAFDVESEGLRASAHVGVSPSLPLETATLESGPMTLRGTFGEATADRALVALRPSGGVNSYDLWFDAQSVGLPATATPISLAKLDVTIQFDDEIRFRGDTAQSVESLGIRDIRLEWGAASLALTGDLTVDAAGYPEGTVTLSASDYNTLIALLEEAEIIVPEAAQTYRNMARSMAKGANTIEVPLVLRNGKINMGPFPIAPAPRLR